MWLTHLTKWIKKNLRCSLEQRRFCYLQIFVQHNAELLCVQIVTVLVQMDLVLYINVLTDNAVGLVLGSQVEHIPVGLIDKGDIFPLITEIKKIFIKNIPRSTVGRNVQVKIIMFLCPRRF